MTVDRDGATDDPGELHHLPATLDAPALARRYIAESGAGLDPELVFDAQLLVSELVTNAIRHGEPEITLRVRLDPPGIGVLVHDSGLAMPLVPADPAAGDQPHGRGLAIVSAVASEWGVEVIDDVPGKTVWFALGVRSGD